MSVPTRATSAGAGGRAVGFWRSLAGACLILLAAASDGFSQVNDTKVYTLVLVDQLEFRSGDADPISWDLQGWIGGDYNKLWLKSEGEQRTGSGAGDAEVQALFSRLISPFWDFQVGVRVDAAYGGAVDRTRGLLAVGIEVEAALFVSHAGDISFRASSTYDLLFSQRLIFQPRFEINAAVQEVPEFGVGSGLNELELGWRMRYELRREFAPYIGISWARRVGGTASLARSEGAEVSDFSLVGGFRVWF
jgi:copper resistance protein B